MKSLLASMICIFPAVAFGAVELDAHMLAWSDELLPLGGDGAVTLGQTFEAEHTAPLVRVDLVIACTTSGSGLVTVEIQGTDGDSTPDESNVLGGVVVDSLDLLSTNPVIQQFPIAGVSLVNGSDYAIVIRGEASVDCVIPEGAGAGFGFGYPGGEAFVAEPAAKPEWEAVEFSSGNDIPFWVYVHVPDPDEPLFCEIADYSGLPQSWEISADLPVCGCLSDSILLHNRCWFSFPEWVVWREIPFPNTEIAAKGTWWLTPMNSDFPGLFIYETDLDGFAYGNDVVFDEGLKPAKAYKVNADYQGQQAGSLVNFEFEIDGQPASVQFKTVIDIPQQN